MAVEYAGGRIVKKAAVDLTGKKYYGVKFDANDQVVIAGAGEAVGVLIEEGKAGQSVTVQYCGETKMVASGVLASGVWVGSDANGKAAAPAVGAKAIALTLEKAAAAGDYVPVCIVHAGTIAIA